MQQVELWHRCRAHGKTPQRGEGGGLQSYKRGVAFKVAAFLLQRICSCYSATFLFPAAILNVLAPDERGKKKKWLGMLFQTDEADCQKKTIFPRNSTAVVGHARLHLAAHPSPY